MCPQHRFYFLTKNPKRLAEFNPWPPNALVGCSITGAETPQRQEEMIHALGEVRGTQRGISYEPLLGEPIVPVRSERIDWIVIGAQSGKSARPPAIQWMRTIEHAAERGNIPVWLKRNLLKVFPELKLRQERP